MTTQYAAHRVRRRRSNSNGSHPVGRPATPTRVELSPGLSLWRGQVNEEYLTDLKPWSKAVKIYQEMQDDVVIGALFEAIKTPLLASPFEVVAASDSEEDIAAKQFIEENLFKMPNLEWTSHVEEMLEFMDMGFAIAEKVLEKREDGLLYLKSLVPIGQESLDEWGPLDEFGNVTSFKQRDKNGKLRGAPIEKLLHFTFRGRKRNPQGRGILRSLYRPWFFKKNLETLEAIGIERDVGNAPVVSLKEGVRYKQEDLDDLASALSGFRMDENLYVILPGGAELTAYGGGNKVYNIREVIRDWQHLIRQRFFADFISLGSEAVGTQALADEMTTFFGLALRSIQEMMLTIWNRQLIPWIFKWNGMEVDNPPQLEWLRPSDMNLQSMAQAYNTLVGANMIDANDTELRNRIRTQLGLKQIDGPLEIGPETDEGLDVEDQEDNIELMELIDNELVPYQFAHVAQTSQGIGLKPGDTVRTNPDRATQSAVGRSIPENEKWVAIFRDERGRGVAVFIRAKSQQIALEAGRKLEATIASRLPGGKFVRLMQNNQAVWESGTEQGGDDEFKPGRSRAQSKARDIGGAAALIGGAGAVAAGLPQNAARAVTRTVRSRGSSSSGVSRADVLRKAFAIGRRISPLFRRRGFADEQHYEVQLPVYTLAEFWVNQATELQQQEAVSIWSEITIALAELKDQSKKVLRIRKTITNDDMNIPVVE